MPRVDGGQGRMVRLSLQCARLAYEQCAGCRLGGRLMGNTINIQGVRAGGWSFRNLSMLPDMLAVYGDAVILADFPYQTGRSRVEGVGSYAGKVPAVLVL